MSPEILVHCLDNGITDKIQLSISLVYERLQHDQITPEDAELKLAELREDLAFIYDAIGVTRKPYRQVA